MSLTLSIEGTDRTAYLQAGSVSITDDLNSRNTCSFVLLDKAGAYRPEVGQEVLIQRDGVTVFGGTIDSYREIEIPGTSALEFAVSCVDYNQIADRHLVAAVYENQLLGDIVRDIVANFLAGEGVTTANVQDGPTITKIVCNYQTVAEALDELAQLTEYAWNIDYNKDLHCFARETYTAPISITDSSNNFRNLTVSKTREQYRNRQYIRAGQDVTDPRTETFAGDGERKAFTLAFAVAKVPSAITVNGTPKTIGIRGVETGKDWYWSKGEKEISQDDGAAALSSSDVLSVTYQGLFPIILSAQNDAAISERQTAEGGSGIYEAIEDDQNIDAQSLATEKADALLRRFGRIPQVVDFETDEDGLAAGQLITINLAAHGLDGEYLIESVNAGDQETFLRYQVRALDGESLGGWQEFFRRLAAAGRQFVIRENEVLILLRRTADTVTLSDTLGAESNPLPRARVDLIPPSFSRASTAYLDGVEYPVDAPRYLAAGGVMTEEETANLLTANQASVETDTTGFNSWQSTIARVTSEYWHGSASLEMTLTEAFGTIYVSYNLSSPVVGTKYAGSTWVKGTSGKQARITVRMLGGANPFSDINSSDITLDGTWQRITVVHAIDYADRTQVQIHIRGSGDIGDKFYFDGLQLEQKSYALSWHLPGTSRARESLTVPNSGLSPAGGTLEVKVEINALARRQVAGQYPEIFNISGGVQTQGILVFHSPTSAHWLLKTMADDNTVTQASFADSLLSDGIHVLRVDWTASQARLYVDTNPVPITTISSPKLPLAFGNVSLGGSSGAVMLNSVIHAVRLSDAPRGAEGLCDANMPLAVDANTLYRALFNGDLSFDPHYHVGFCEVAS